MPKIKQTQHGTKIGDVEFLWARNSKEFLFANSIYIKGKPSILVDPSATFTYIEHLALTHAVNIIINTHYHGDHRSLNHLFSNVIFAAHEADAPAIRDYKIYDKFADVDPNSFYTEWRKQVFQKYQIHDSPVSQTYKGGEIIETDSTQIEIVHTPGHTPGHIAFYFKNIDCLFLSDIDLTPYGPWYANVVSDIDDFKRSVEKILKIQAKYFVTSHGERIYDPEMFQEKILRFFKCFDERDERIIDLLTSGPKELIELAGHGIIYRKGALIDPLKVYFQWQMIQKHLERLISKGVIFKEGEKYAMNKS